MVAMKLEVGILWNTRKNQAYEIRVPDRKTFLDAVAKTVTKGFLNQYKCLESENRANAKQSGDMTRMREIKRLAKQYGIRLKDNNFSS